MTITEDAPITIPGTVPYVHAGKTYAVPVVDPTTGKIDPSLLPSPAPPPPPPPPPPGQSTMGWFAGNGSAGIDAVGQLAVLGASPCQLFHVFNSFWTPSYLDIGQNFNPVNGQGKSLAGSQGLLITIPLCATGTNGAPVPGMLLSDTLTLANVNQYGILAQKLDAVLPSGQVIYVRPGHECNAGWYGWGNQGRVLYKESFVAVVETMRAAAPKRTFLFEWNVSGGWAPLTAQQPNPGTPFRDAASGETWEETYLGWYPGAAYVDVLGQDTYVGKWSMGLTTPHDESWIPAVYDALVKMAVQLGKPWATSEYGSNFGANPNPVVNGVTIDGDGVTATLITAAATVLKGQRPASSWDAEIGGWTASSPPPPGAYHVVYNWDNANPGATYMTSGSGTAVTPNPVYAKSCAALKAAWPA